MKTIEQRKLECEEARMALAQAIARHPLRRQWENAIELYGKSHQAVRDIHERLTSKIDTLPEWIAYQDAWIAAHGTTHFEEEGVSRRQKSRLKGSKKGVQSIKTRMRVRNYIGKKEDTDGL